MRVVEHEYLPYFAVTAPDEPNLSSISPTVSFGALAYVFASVFHGSVFHRFCQAVHATCTTRKMGLVDTLLKVARTCARKAVLPEEIGCCAFAGDKGFTNPELNKWALRKLRARIEEAGATMGYSNSRTCEIGLTHHSGIPYMGIVYLVNRAASPKRQ